MISYEPFFKTIKEKGISQYTLINECGVSRSLIDKLKHNKNVEVATIDNLCQILNCEVNDIVQIINDSNYERGNKQ